jgi:imidazolonepropionase-like amidohydrolase
MKWLTPDDWKRAKQIYDKSFDIAREMHRQGVRFLAGTDLVNAYIFPGFSLHDELTLLVKAGLSNLEALQAATWNAALFMNASDKYGSVAPGKIADLVLLDADPLKDIHNTTRISEVFLSGKEFDRAALDKVLRYAEAAAKPATSR